MIWSPLSRAIIKAYQDNKPEVVKELFKIGWDEIEKRHKARMKRCWFHIGIMDYGMRWGIVLFGKAVYMKETNWRKT